VGQVPDRVDQQPFLLPPLLPVERDTTDDPTTTDDRPTVPGYCPTTVTDDR